jgi:hypothetical protein
MMTVGAAESGDDGPGRASAASEALNSMNAELSVATSISSSTPASIAFVVPDRNGDGSPESIVYTWSGPGNPMQRSYNGGRAATFLNAVQSCRVDVAQRPAARPVESSEQILASFTSPTGGTSTHISVDASNFAAQYVRPVLPAGATAWKITKIALSLSQNSGNSKVFNISVTTASGSLRPTSTVLGTFTMTSGASPGSSQMVTGAIGPITGLAPTQGVCILVQGSAGGTTNVWFNSGGTNQPFNTHYMSSTNSGSTWSAPNDADDMLFAVYGTYTTMVEP